MLGAVRVAVLRWASFFLLLLGSTSSEIKGLGFVEALWRAVIAFGGLKSSKVEGLGFVEPL